MGSHIGFMPYTKHRERQTRLNEEIAQIKAYYGKDEVNVGGFTAQAKENARWEQFLDATAQLSQKKLRVLHDDGSSWGPHTVEHIEQGEDDACFVIMTANAEPFAITPEMNILVETN